MTNKINAEQGRLIDLEPFTLFGKRFFAYVWVNRRQLQGAVQRGPNAKSSDPTCKNWKTMQNATYDKFMGEPYRLAIRGAIATWPSS